MMPLATNVDSKQHYTGTKQHYKKYNDRKCLLSTLFGLGYSNILRLDTVSLIDELVLDQIYLDY